MSRRDLFRTDASDFERSSLESVLKKDRQADDPTTYLSVEEALRDDSVYEVKTAREVTRVLFISRDESLLNPSQQSLDGYTNIADLFDEVHILILRQGIQTKTPVLRVADNVWLYTATHQIWWLTPLSGRYLAENQLVFADGFRPDMIVARDPFESAVLALYLGKKYNRPVQVHVLENYTAPEFKLDRTNHWRCFIPRYTLSRARSVRATTRVVFDYLAKRFAIPDLALLPRFNNYESLMKQPSTFDLREKYKPFLFIMLYIGRLGHESAFPKALEGARFGLRNPHLGLIVLGSGPAQKEFIDRAAMLKVSEQVVFEPQVKDREIIPYLKSANVLLVPDTTPESEEIVLQGAAAGIPLILARTPAREDIFRDGESALLCDPSSADDFSLKLNILLNDVVLRRQMIEAAQDMIGSRFHENREQYEAAYRESLEQVLFLDELTRKEKVPEPL
jgi:glycosyltransferase involved in cell wall biosynthesis